MHVPRILLADDDTEMSALLEDYLGARGIYRTMVHEGSPSEGSVPAQRIGLAMAADGLRAHWGPALARNRSLVRLEPHRLLPARPLPPA